MTRELPVRNPRTGQDDYAIQALDADEVAAAALTLRQAQESWTARGVEERCAIVSRWADSLFSL